jgi:hypothetical protein
MFSSGSATSRRPYSCKSALDGWLMEPLSPKTAPGSLTVPGAGRRPSAFLISN